MNYPCRLVLARVPKHIQPVPALSMSPAININDLISLSGNPLKYVPPDMQLAAALTIVTGSLHV